MRWMAVSALVAMIAACSPIKQYAEVAQPVGPELVGNIGDTVLTVHSSESMPNIAGRADLFGRTRPTGITTYQFIGAEGNRAKFIRRSAVIQSGATTMNSTPIVIPNYQTTTVSGYVGTTPIYGQAQTQGPPTIIPASPPPGYVFPQQPVAVELDLDKERTVSIAGRTITILRVTPTQIFYRIT